MPRYIIKPRQDEDVYVEWSTIVDAHVSCTMTRAEAVAAHSEERIARADESGHSWLWTREPFWDGTIIVSEVQPCPRGTIRTADVGRFVDAFEAGDYETAGAFITPFEDNEDEDEKEETPNA
ncbi:hypothetical protein ACT3SZ_15510 [Corynebacterium sp. AOP40-9SA-29]|uniref:hypothetical protein n=1 Tax=Corynebacterium sp. AOP40-9SA-29 TaxID=3457677 RepID=UPI004033216A